MGTIPGKREKKKRLPKDVPHCNHITALSNKTLIEDIQMKTATRISVSSRASRRLASPKLTPKA
jgi:hypothetical protein